MKHPPATAQAMERALASASDTRFVVVRPGAISASGDLFRAAFPGRAAVVVADQTTYAVAGNAVEASLAAAGHALCPPIVLPASPRLSARHEHVEEVRAALERTDAVPVAVGSGTVNDLTKLAAHRIGRRYMAVATAASMDGYAAFGAAITRDGFKSTVGCRAPRAVLADVDVLAAAPREMTSWGFGDLIGKITAGADWLVADAVGAEPIDREIWSLVQGSVREAIADAPLLVEADPSAVERLFRCLIVTGLAMQAARSSRPASGSEHQFSHLWEMSAHEAEVSHGFKVGIGTVAVGALYERLLDLPIADLPVDRLVAGWPTLDAIESEVRAFHADPEIGRQAVTESRAKYVDGRRLRDRLALLRERWPALQAELRAQLLPMDEVLRLLEAALCPTDPRDIGIDLPRLRASYAAARSIRRRYTVLDLAAETGSLGPILDDLFGPSGPFAGPRVGWMEAPA